MILVRQIRPSIRLLCAGVGGFLLSGVGLWFQAYGLEGAVPFALVAGGLLAVGVIGGLDDAADEPPGTGRFHELADPARALTPDDFRRATPEPVHYEAGRDPAPSDARSLRT